MFKTIGGKNKVVDWRWQGKRGRSPSQDGVNLFHS